MKTLLLLTHNFPFGNHETFLEHEVPVIAKNFDSVVVLPTRHYKTESSDKGRPLPHNCRVIANKGYHSKRCVFASPRIYQRAIRLVKVADFHGLKNPGRFQQVYEILKTSFFASHVFWQIKNLRNQDIRIDLVYSYWLAEMAIGTAEAIRSGCISHGVSRAHRYDLYPTASKLGYHPFRQFLTLHLDKIFPISLDGMCALRKEGYPVEKTGVQYLGVPRSGSMNPGSSNRTLRIVSCSRVEPIKQVDRIFELVIRLSERIPVQWTHFGEGSGFLALQNKLRNRPPSLKVELKGLQSNRSVLEFYRSEAIDFFINLSKSEGVPVSIMEAMACGIPAVATDVGGTRELLEDEAGILIPAEFDLDYVCSEILRSFENTKVRSLMRKKAIQMWQNRFNSEKNFEEFSEELRKLCQKI